MFDISSYENNVVMVGIKKIGDDGQELINVRGSGFLVEGGRLITCHHVFAGIPVDSRRNVVCWSPYERKNNITKYSIYDISLVGSDIRNDIALFMVHKNDSKKKLLGEGLRVRDLISSSNIINVKPGADIYFLGYPLANEFLGIGMGITQTVSKAVVSSIKYRGEDNQLDFMLIDKLINPGSSGSPVFIKIKGKYKILGIASGTLNKSHKIGETLINIPVSIGMLRASPYIYKLIKDN